MPQGLSSLEQLPLPDYQEFIATEAMKEAMAAGAFADAREITGMFPRESEIRPVAIGSVSTYLASNYLNGEDTAAALEATNWGHANGSPPDVLFENQCVAAHRRAISLVANGLVAEARALAESLDEAGCSAVSPWDRAVLRGVIARTEAQAMIARATPAFEEAMSTLSDALGYAGNLGQQVAFIQCDLAAVYEPLVIVALSRGNARRAIELIDESEGYVAGRPFTRRIMPDALIALGRQALVEGQFEEAIEALETATRLAPDKRRETDALLADAHEARAWRSYAALALDAAVGDFRVSLRYESTRTGAKRGLYGALLARGVDSFNQGGWTSGRRDLNDSFRLTPDLRSPPGYEIPSRDVRMAGTVFRDVAWLQIPPASEPNSVIDIDGNQTADVLLFELPRTRETVVVALTAEERNPRVAFLFSGANMLSRVWRDFNGNGRFDEIALFSSNNHTEAWTDADFDRSPDVIVRYNGDRETGRQPLSGKVLMRFRGGVVGTSTDVFSDADAFLKVYKNRTFLNETRVRMNTNFPSWDDGIAVDYKYEDRVVIELWDNDFISPDDLVDRFIRDSLPTSGVFRSQNGLAAVDITVSSTDLPEGYLVRGDPDRAFNVFEQDPTEVPIASDIIRNAELANLRAEFLAFAAEFITFDVVLPGLFPQQRGAIEALRRLGIRLR